jgi:hypothetical protein
MDIIDTALENPLTTAAITTTVAATVSHVVLENDTTTTAIVGVVTFVGTVGLCKAFAPAPFVAQVGDLRAEVRDQGKTVSIKLNVPKTKENMDFVKSMVSDAPIPQGEKDSLNKVFKAA